MKKILTILLPLLLCLGCTCHSSWFRRCHQLTWAEMCSTESECVKCVTESKSPEFCWKKLHPTAN